MTNDPPETLWPRISADLREAVGAHDFDIWLAPLEVAGYDGRLLVLRAPEETRAWVADRFGPLIIGAARTLLGPDLELRVVSGAEQIIASADDGGGPPEHAADPPLNPKLRFDQFVLGAGNRFAHAAALAVAENPGSAYNPLFLCGPPGVGKTHLLHSVAEYIQRHDPSMRVRLTTAEAFITEFVAATRRGGMERFKARHRGNDILLVDDVQFLMAKTRTEEEFFHTFNALRDGGAQVMLTSDRVPRDLDGLHERLRDRFESGLVAGITPPDMATRLAVLRMRAIRDELPMPGDAVLEAIARRVRTNLRALEGALIRVVAYASMRDRQLDEALTAEVLDDLFPEPAARAGDTRVTIEDVQVATCSAFGITREELVSDSRANRVAWPRQVAMFLARRHTDESLPAIGASFGGRGHTTVMHAVRRTAERVQSDPELSTIVDDLSTTLSEPRADRSD